MRSPALIRPSLRSSNWDGVWALVYKVAIGAEIHFFGKKSLFWFPLSSLLRWLGVIPLDRARAGSAVQQAIDMFKEQDSFYFGLAPEGTRTKKPGWKSGFYRIAQGAGVPVYMGFLDFQNKRVGIGTGFHLSGDQEADLEIIRDFYAGIQGRWPEKTSPIKFTTP